MATLNLSNYKNSSSNTSILGYSTGLAGNKDNGYSLVASSVMSDTSIKKVAEVGQDGVVALYTNASFTDTNVTALKGDDTQAWSIVGSEYNATVTSITTGKNADTVQMAAMNDGAKIETGDGADVVSVVTAAGSLNVNAGAGNDSVSVGTANGALTIALGEGTNVASVNSAKSTMDISGGKGADSVMVNEVEGNATIRLGDGSNEVSVSAAKANLTVSTGSGTDSVSLGTVTGNADINVGNGTNFVSLTSVDGTLTVNGGSGADSVYVDTKVTGTATISLGDGADSVSIAAAEGDVKVETGVGNDTVGIGNVGKSLTVNLGDGTDELTVAKVETNVVVNGAAGAQKVTLNDAVGGDATIALGAGKDSVVLGSSANVEGKLSITTSGTDANVVEISGSKYEGGVAITMGSGADSISIGSATVGGTISLGDGKDSLFVAGLNTATVTSGAGDKVASIGAAEAASLTFGAGKDSLVIANVKSSTIDLGDGKDTVSLGAGFEESTLNLGAGDDIISLAGDAKSGTINLGAGNDTISVGAGLGEITIAGGAGKDSINLAGATSGTATLTDFEVGVDTLVTGTATFNAGMFTSDGMVSVGSSSAKAAVTGNGNYAVTTEFGNVAWAGETGTLMNASAFTSKAIFIGTDNEDAADTIIGGSKDDSIFAGANDVVYGGAGNDSIVVSSSSDAVYVGLANGAGKDSVSGFRSGTDVVYLFDNNITDISKIEVSGTNTVMKLGTSTLTLEGTTAVSDVVVRDKSGVDRKVALVSATTTIDRDLDKMADIYYSTAKTGTALDFSNVDDALVVDLGNTGLLTNTHSATYTGKFETVTGGKDNTILFGAKANSETLQAGTGNATLWGGGSASDSLTHASGTNTVTFFYGSGDGKDTITSSNWGGSDENDVLWFGSSNLSSIKNDGTNTTVTFTSTGDKLTLAGVTDANTVIKFTTDAKTISKAKFGQAGTSNTYNYAEDVAFYMGGTKNTLSVGSDVDTANIWLDGRDGKTYENIAAVDASSNSGDVVIAGLGNVNETITASRGTSLIWGGEGTSNDTLVGTSGGTATYFWGNGNGSDVITDSHSDDLVNLYNVALSDIAKIDTTTTSMKWTLNDGSTLTINNMSSSSVKKFQLTDSSWEYDSSTQQWNRLS